MHRLVSHKSWEALVCEHQVHQPSGQGSATLLGVAVCLNGENVQAHKGQESMEKKISLLEAHQKEIHDSLVSMENVALHMYQVIPFSFVLSSCLRWKLLTSK